jgi:hypothetical protein
MRFPERGATDASRAGVRRACLGALVVALMLTACSLPERTTPPTAAPVSTAPVVFATSSPVAVQTPFATPIPPPATPTVRIEIPTPAPAAPRPLYVANTGGEGLALRNKPASDGERIAVLSEGTALTPTGQEEQADGRRWRQVRDPQGREGWVAADFLSASVPGASLVSASPEPERGAPPPTQGITVPPPPPTPTRAPTRVPGTSAPVGPGTAKPQVPAVVVPTIGTRFSPPASPTPR